MNSIVITGASGGVGRSLLKLFLKDGWKVYALIRDKDKISDLNHKNLVSIEYDAKNFSSTEKAFAKIKDLDVLVNNAATFKSKEILDFKENEIHDIIDTNLKGPIFCVMNALKIMKTGRIINISSVSGLHGIPSQTIYSSSKHGLMGFSESLSQELIKKDILVTDICPGGIDTPLWNPRNPYNGNTNELISPEDIAQCVKFVCNLPKNIVMKRMTTFPKCEWH